MSKCFQISYKASLLHLQPRQMRLIVSELRDDMPLTYSKEVISCSEDEEEPDTRELKLQFSFIYVANCQYINIELLTFLNFR